MALRLPRLSANQTLVGPDGRATMAFTLWWAAAMNQIEASVNSIQDALDAAAVAQAAAVTANAAAVVANTAAEAAQTAVEETEAETSLSSSYVTGLTLTAADVGANVTVTISAHTRVYGNGTSVSVNGGTVTGLPYSTEQRIYYDQASRLGGAVTYQATTSSATAAQTGIRHSVGGVLTPAAAAPPATGSPVYPPGHVYI